MRQLGEQIRTFRAGRGWTQVRLADALGTDAITVSRWERGVSHPRPTALRQLMWLGLAPGPSSEARFSEEPATRIRKLDSARREQLEMKERVRFVP